MQTCDFFTVFPFKFTQKEQFLYKTPVIIQNNGLNSFGQDVPRFVYEYFLWSKKFAASHTEAWM